MDPFAGGMTARGPTLGPDRESWTGSIHIVDLPSAAAAREFVDQEPYNRAGLFEQHMIRPFTNLLGRTMWEFPGGAGHPRFFVLADADLEAPPRERLIVHGELLEPPGVVLALEAPTRAAVDELLAAPGAQILDWEFGGRR